MCTSLKNLIEVNNLSSISKKNLDEKNEEKYEEEVINSLFYMSINYIYNLTTNKKLKKIRKKFYTRRYRDNDSIKKNPLDNFYKKNSKNEENVKLYEKLSNLIPKPNEFLNRSQRYRFGNYKKTKKNENNQTKFIFSEQKLFSEKFNCEIQIFQIKIFNKILSKLDLNLIDEKKNVFLITSQNKFNYLNYEYYKFK
jgi:hypothetical protein